MQSVMIVYSTRDHAVKHGSGAHGRSCYARIAEDEIQPLDFIPYS